MQYTNAYEPQPTQQLTTLGQQHSPMLASQQPLVYNPTLMDLNQMTTLIQFPMNLPVPNSLPSLVPPPFPVEQLLFPAGSQPAFQNMANYTACYVDPQTGFLTPVSRSRSPSQDYHETESVDSGEGAPLEEQLPQLPEFNDNTSGRSATERESVLLLDDKSSGPQKKYAYRSKQRKIDKTRGLIEEKFSLMNLFAGEKELVRGDDTVRVHVKTFQGLTEITKFLDEVENHREITITRIACPFSKKNKNQKKGFIVYLKLQTVQQMEIVKEVIFPKYQSVLKSCVVARPREMPPAPEVEAITEKFDSLSFSMAPRGMIKRSSFGG